MRNRLFVAACWAAFCFLCAVAVADTIKVDDNRNARSNLLDIKSASAGHRDGRLEHTIDTYRAWRSGELRSTRSRPRAVCLYVWNQGRSANGKQDYEVCARFAHRRLRAYVWKVRPKRKRVAGVTVRRLSLRSITFDFDERQIGSPRLYRWQVVTGYTGKRCPRDPPFQFGCDDSAPTRGAQVHDLRIEDKKG